MKHVRFNQISGSPTDDFNSWYPTGLVTTTFVWYMFKTLFPLKKQQEEWFWLFYIYIIKKSILFSSQYSFRFIATESFLGLISFVVGVQLVAMIITVGFSSGSGVPTGVTFVFRIVRVTLAWFVVVIGLTLSASRHSLMHKLVILKNKIWCLNLLLTKCKWNLLNSIMHKLVILNYQSSMSN